MHRRLLPPIKPHRSIVHPPLQCYQRWRNSGRINDHIEGHASRICLPHTFRSSVCETHDDLTDHDLECVEGGWLEPELCTRKFCYVDAEKCRNSEERMYRSIWFPQGSGVDLVRVSFVLFLAVLCTLLVCCAVNNFARISYKNVQQFYSYTTCDYAMQHSTTTHEMNKRVHSEG